MEGQGIGYSEVVSRDVRSVFHTRIEHEEGARGRIFGFKITFNKMITLVRV